MYRRTVSGFKPLGLVVLAAAALGCHRPAGSVGPRARSATVSSATVSSATVSSATVSSATRRDGPPAPDWPRELLVAHDDGPALFRRSGPDAAPVAWVAGGEALRPRGAVRGGRVRAVIDGGLRLRGWIAIDRLEAVVLRRGRLRGTPVFLSPGDRVRLRAARGRLATLEAAARLGHPSLELTAPFRGELPLSRLGAQPAGVAAGPTSGAPVLVRGAARLHASPDGPVVYALPALEPALVATVLRDEGAWVGVRLGVGPYLVGYLPRAALAMREAPASKQSIAPEVLDPWRRGASPAPSESGVRDPWSERAAPGPQRGLPPRLRDAVVRPVWRVAAGARVEVEGATVAVFTAEGWAVELERDGERVRILGAVDESATVIGVVPASALRAADGATGSADEPPVREDAATDPGDEAPDDTVDDTVDDAE